MRYTTEIEVDLAEITTEELIEELHFRNITTPTKIDNLVREIYVAKATNQNLDELLDQLFLSVIGKRI